MQKSVRFVDGFHKIYIIEQNSSARIFVVRVETDKNPNDTRPDYIWPDAWTRIGKVA